MKPLPRGGDTSVDSLNMMQIVFPRSITDLPGKNLMFSIFCRCIAAECKSVICHNVLGKIIGMSLVPAELCRTPKNSVEVDKVNILRKQSCGVHRNLRVHQKYFYTHFAITKFFALSEKFALYLKSYIELFLCQNIMEST